MKNLIYLISIFNCITFTSILNAQVAENGLVGYFPFSGDANDRSGNCNNGNVHNADLTIDRFNFQDAAYHFDGSGSQYIEIPGSSFGNKEYSFSVWASAEAIPVAGDAYGVISVGGTDFRDQIIGLRNEGYGSTSYNDDLSDFVLYSQKPPVLGKWTHIVSTRSLDKVQLFLDGILVDEQKVSSFLNTFYSPNLVATIGIRHNLMNPFNGKIDDVRIYNRALTSDEILALYNEHLCFENISVTDTLVINANITSFSPLNFNINIKVYPNPTLDHLIIDAGDISKLVGYSFKISNSSGIEVYQSDINKQFFDLDMNKWKGKGLYLMYLYDSNSNIVDVKKIVLQ